MTDDKLTALGDPENVAYEEIATPEGSLGDPENVAYKEVRRLDGPTFERPAYSEVCALCRHLDRSSTMGAETCDAFPTGIPPAIWFGQDDHREPVEGDHGIQFEPIA